MNKTRYLSLLIAIFFVLCASPIVVSAEEGAKPEGGHEKAEKAEGGGHNSEGAKKGGGDTTTSGDNTFVRMAPLVLPVIDDRGVQQIVTISLTLHMKDFNAADDVHNNLPRVQDGIMQALYGGFSDGSLRIGHMLDLSKVKAKIIRALNKVLGPDKVQDVLIQGVAQRMLQ